MRHRRGCYIKTEYNSTTRAGNQADKPERKKKSGERERKNLYSCTAQELSRASRTGSSRRCIETARSGFMMFSITFRASVL